MFQLWPLLLVVAVDDECNTLAPRYFNQFLSAGSRARFVLIIDRKYNTRVRIHLGALSERHQ
jgi:hypothetical protein